MRIAAWVAGLKTGEAKAVKKKVAARECPLASLWLKALHSPAAVEHPAVLLRLVAQFAPELRKFGNRGGLAASRPRQTEDNRYQQF